MWNMTGSSEWNVEIQMYMLLGVKTKFESIMGRNNIMSLPHCQQYIS